MNRARSMIFIAPALALLLATGCATGADRTSHAPASSTEASDAKVALAVRSPRHLRVAMMTAREMLSGQGDVRASRVDVIACGDAVPALVGHSEIADQVRATQAAGARIVACGLTIEQKGIDPTGLIEGVEVAPNGLTEIVRLQTQGYYSVEL